MIVFVFGSFWIYGKTRTNKQEQEMWETRSYITIVVGLIVLSFMIAGNMIYYEVSFNKKCAAVEHFMTKQLDRLKSQVDVNKIATDTSRIIADALTKEVKSRLVTGITSGIISDLLQAVKT
jgi:hypothetical protein